MASGLKLAFQVTLSPFLFDLQYKVYLFKYFVGPTIARSFAEHAPWVVAEEQDPMQHDFRPENFTDNENIKRNLIIGKM